MNRKHLLEVTEKYAPAADRYAKEKLAEPTEAELIIASQPYIVTGTNEGVDYGNVGLLVAVRQYRIRTDESLVACLVAFYRAARAYTPVV